MIPSPNIREPNLAAKLGCTTQSLRNLRVGERKNKYTYPPSVAEGIDWYKDGAVFWTPEGQRKAGRLITKRTPPTG